MLILPIGRNVNHKTGAGSSKELPAGLVRPVAFLPYPECFLRNTPVVVIDAASVLIGHTVVCCCPCNAAIGKACKGNAEIRSHKEFLHTFALFTSFCGCGFRFLAYLSTVPQASRDRFLRSDMDREFLV